MISNTIIAILFNEKTNTFHPVVLEHTPSEDGLNIFEPKGYHAVTFNTIQEAIVECKSMIDIYKGSRLYDKDVIKWNGNTKTLEHMLIFVVESPDDRFSLLYKA